MPSAEAVAPRRMTALGKVLRTTAFKLSLVYLTVFALFAAVLIIDLIGRTAGRRRSR